MSAIEEVYKKFKHLDGCLGDPEWCKVESSGPAWMIAGELWRAVKEARDRPRPPCEECIYQSQSAEHDALIAAQATAAENKRALDAVKESIDKYMINDPKARGHASIHKSIWRIIESLRLAQPEPTERDPK